MDVQISHRAWKAFRKIFLDIGGIDPFFSATDSSSEATIASACSYLYRKKFLKPNTIGILPPTGYRRADNNHSLKAVEWLLKCEREIGREIIHAGRAREYKLPEGFLVDGYLPPWELPSASTSSDSIAATDKSIVFEYQGCYTHVRDVFKTNAIN